jgi:hypothetical protein
VVREGTAETDHVGVLAVHSSWSEPEGVDGAGAYDGLRRDIQGLHGRLLVGNGDVPSPTGCRERA